MTNPASNACDQITKALEQDRLELPTLPEVAFKVRDVAERDEVTIPQLCRVIEQDPALAAHLIKVANSPMFRATRPSTHAGRQRSSPPADCHDHRIGFRIALASTRATKTVHMLNWPMKSQNQERALLEACPQRPFGDMPDKCC